jgi:hypothetical protein
MIHARRSVCSSKLESPAPQDVLATAGPARNISRGYSRALVARGGGDTSVTTGRIQIHRARRRPSVANQRTFVIA